MIIFILFILYLWWQTEQCLEEIVQIYVIFISNKSIIKKIKKMVSCVFNLKYLSQNLVKLYM